MFKAKSSKKKFRSRRQSSDDEEGSGDVEEVLKVAKEMQKVRKRQSGVGAVALATGAKISNEEEILVENDPFKLNSGGLVDMKNVKDRNRDRTYEDSDRDVTNLGTTFSAETNRRDEDAELASFIESEIRKRKGIIKGDSAPNVSHKSAEDQLFELPEHLKIAVKKQSEEMLSNQMLNGIPEIDLGIEVKIKNIERTEEAKQSLIREQINKKKAKATFFVPMNMAVNYVQHRRFMQEERQEKKAEKQEPEPVPLVVGDVSRQSNSLQAVKRQTNDKASDDFHYNKFRKQARR